MTFWKFVTNNPQIIAVALAFGVPAVARILKKLGEQSAKRSAGIRREQQELESLRTGRAPIPDAPQQAASARATLEEMAAKRRAQIEELRQRRQTQMNSAPAPQPARVQATAPVTRPPAAGRTQQVRTTPTDRRPFQAAPPGLPTAPSRPAPAPTVTPDQRARLKARQEGKAREQAEVDRRQRAKQKTDAEHQRRVTNQQRDRAPRMTQQAAAVAAATQTVEAVATAKQELAATTAVARIPKRNIVLAGGDWRKAFIMQELISPPLALRE